MAYTRTKKTELKTSLSYFIKGLSDNLTEQIKARNAEDEVNFNKAVLEGNISLDAQLAFREEQLKRGIDIPEERNRIKEEISNLKQRIEQKTFSDAYTKQVMDLSSGAISIDSMMGWLKGQKTTTKNQAIIDAIDKQLVDLSSKKFEYTKQLISNQTEYAAKDKSEQVLNEQIKVVESEKNKALLTGDKTLASNYDLQLQTLKKAKSEVSIEKAKREIVVQSLTGVSTAIGMLDSYNKRISNASTNYPISIDGQTFANERDYWTFVRDNYVADQTSSGLLPKLEKEIGENIATLNSKNILTQDALVKAVRPFDQIANRPELQGFENVINNSKTATLQGGANLVAEEIVNNFATDYDLNKAIGDLKGLSDLGVNVSNSINSTLSSNAQLKQSMLSTVLSVAVDLQKANPGLSSTELINQALSLGAGKMYSPTQAANLSVREMATSDVSESSTKTAKEDPRLTLAKTPTPTPAPKPTPTPAPKPTPTPGVQSTQTAPKNNAYTIQAGDTLSKLAARNNTTVAKLMELNPQITDANMIIAGQQLNIAPAQTGVVTPTQQPTQQTQQQPSGGGSSTSTQPKVNTPTSTSSTSTQPKANTQTTTTTTTPKAPTVYQGISIVDYLNSVGKDSSYSARAKLAKNYGIAGYTGSPDQNKKLLRTLRGF